MREHSLWTFQTCRSFNLFEIQISKVPYKWGSFCTGWQISVYTILRCWDRSCILHRVCRMIKWAGGYLHREKGILPPASDAAAGWSIHGPQEWPQSPCHPQKFGPRCGEPAARTSPQTHPHPQSWLCHACKFIIIHFFGIDYWRWCNNNLLYLYSSCLWACWNHGRFLSHKSRCVLWTWPSNQLVSI